MKVYAGEFIKIYDPSIGESKPWYVNDHALFQGKDAWHLFGITHEEPASPLEERLCAHATSRDLLEEPFCKCPPPFSAEESKQELHFWAPHVLEHEGLYYMYYCFRLQL